MKVALVAAIVVALGLTPGHGVAAVTSKTKPAKTPVAAVPKAGPGCAALTFRPLPSGGADGEQTAGLYKSRFARIELHASVQNGAPTNYFLTANRNHLGAAPQALPDMVASCANTKRMPKPQGGSLTCTGNRFTAVVAHAGQQRVALLYGFDGIAWSFCSAGSF